MTAAFSQMPETITQPSSVDEVAAGLRGVGYLPGSSTALVSFLATKLGKPVLVEGPAGVGKTELAKALARYLGRTLVRLQCYEGLDEAKALYEWNYRKQLLRIQTESDDAGWDNVQDDIFGEEFLLERPLMTAIASPEPVVLLIDEIDKTDQEFEAMLLELLSDFQISIPELGRIEARTRPVVLLTSNNTRELTEALKRRCLYLWLDYPELEHELQIVRLHSPDLDETLARKLVEIIHQVRELDLKKPPSIAESIDWARALLLLGANDIDGDTFRETMSVIVKHRTDLDTVAARVGVKLERPDERRPPGGLTAPPRRGRPPRTEQGSTPGSRTACPGGFDAELLAFAEELREEGMALGTSELLDAFAALEQIPWTSQREFKGALSATLAKSPDDARTFDLVFERFFFRAAEAEAARRRDRRGRPARRPTCSTSTSTPSASRSPRRSGTGPTQRCGTSPGSPSPPSAAARGPASSVWMCSGSAARSGCGPSRSPTCPRTTRAARGCRASSSGALSSTSGASSNAT